MERPKFSDILKELENIRTTYQTLRRQHFELGRCYPLNTVHNQNYISALERLSMHSNSSATSRFSLINPNFVPYNNVQPLLQHPHTQVQPHHHLQQQTNNNIAHHHHQQQHNHHPHHSHHHPTQAFQLQTQQQLTAQQHPHYHITQHVPLVPQRLHSPADEYLYPNSRLTSATLVLEPSLSSHSSTSGGGSGSGGGGSGSSSSRSSQVSHSSTPNLVGPYLNANGRPATIYEGHNNNSLARSIDIENYQIPIRT